MQHERRPVFDKKNDANKSSTSENDQESLQSKQRVKKDCTSDSVNYLSLFQLNPLLSMNPLVSSSPSIDTTSIKTEEHFADENIDAKNCNTESLDLFETVLEQKVLNDTLTSMLASIEESLQASLQGNFDAHTNGSSEGALSQSFLLNLLDEELTQFKIQLPNLLPKMHFICEIGSRILFKVRNFSGNINLSWQYIFQTIDWLRDIGYGREIGFDTNDQIQMLRLNWTELLVVGLGLHKKHFEPCKISYFCLYCQLKQFILRPQHRPLIWKQW